MTTPICQGNWKVHFLLSVVEKSKLWVVFRYASPHINHITEVYLTSGLPFHFWRPGGVRTEMSDRSTRKPKFSFATVWLPCNPTQPIDPCALQRWCSYHASSLHKPWWEKSQQNGAQFINSLPSHRMKMTKKPAALSDTGRWAAEYTTSTGVEEALSVLSLGHLRLQS